MKPSRPSPLRRDPSDWVGFVFYATLAVSLLVQSSGITLLLIPTLAQEAVIAAAFLLRDPARRRLRGWTPRLAAYVGTLGLLLFIQAARAWQPAWLAPADSPLLRGPALTLWLTGSVLAAWSAWYLRVAFSLEPEARALVVGGPYRLARHPIYTGYLLQYAGMWLMYPTAPFALALGAWFAVLLARVRYEEAVLRLAFAEYGEYCRRVGAFAPRLARPLTAQGGTQ